MNALSMTVVEDQPALRARGRGEGGSQWRAGERCEPARNGDPPSPRPKASGGAPPDVLVGPAPAQEPRPDPEVADRPVRRRFTAEYKRRVLMEAEACSRPGQLGALLRREGLYSSHLVTWRRQREQALAQGLAPRKRGRKPTRDPRTERIGALERENARLRRKLDEAKLIIDIQKKTSQLLGIKLTDVSAHERALEEPESE